MAYGTGRGGSDNTKGPKGNKATYRDDVILEYSDYQRRGDCAKIEQFYGYGDGW